MEVLCARASSRVCSPRYLDPDIQAGTSAERNVKPVRAATGEYKTATVAHESVHDSMLHKGEKSMNQHHVHTSKGLLWACISVLALSFSMPAVATTASTSPEAGSYCPGRDILLVVAEDLSASLDMAMRSRAALVKGDQATAIADLTSAGTALHLAASRGAAARTILLIDAIIQARAGVDYARMLEWFPVLQTSLLTLPDDARLSAADDLIGRAKDIMLGDAKESDPMEPLKKARHMLACDGLDIPLQEAMRAQDNLMKVLGRNTKNSAYDTLIHSLRSALVYTLENSEK
jgi:hypothetical protein